MSLPEKFQILPLGSPFMFRSGVMGIINTEVQTQMRACVQAAIEGERALVCVLLKVDMGAPRPIALGRLGQVAAVEDRLEFTIEWSSNPMVEHLRTYWESTKVAAEPIVAMTTVRDDPLTFQFFAFHVALSGPDQMGFSLYLHRATNPAIAAKDKPS